MKITASSKYDWETVKKFNFFHNIVRKKALNIALLVLDLLCVLLFVLVYRWGLLDSNMIMIYLLLVLVNAVLAFALFVLPKIQYKQNKALQGMKNEITFAEQEFTLAQQGNNAIATTTIKYDAIWRVYETADCFYVYINPRQAYIVDKSTIIGGTSVDLRMFLVKEIGISKYKLKSKV